MTIRLLGRRSGLMFAQKVFSPADIGGGTLKLWLKADTGVYSDAGVTPAVNNDTVQQWNDQSGVGNHLTQATSSKRPSFLTGVTNGLPAIKGDGVDDNLFTTAATGIAANGTSFTLVVVVKTGTITGHVPVDVGVSAGGVAGKELRVPQDPTGFVMALSTATAVIGSSTTAIVNTTNYVITFTYTSPNGTFYINGVSAGAISNAQTFSATPTNIYVCSEDNIGSLAFPNHIFEVLYYDAQISAANLNALHRYLGSKYGLF